VQPHAECRSRTFEVKHEGRVLVQPHAEYDSRVLKSRCAAHPSATAMFEHEHIILNQEC